MAISWYKISLCRSATLYLRLFSVKCFEEMELCPRINCWTTRTVLLVTFVVFLIHQDNQQNIASASPTPLLSGFEDYSEGKVRCIHFFLNFLLVYSMPLWAIHNYIYAVRVYILLRDVDRLNGEQPSLYELLLQREMLADKLDSEGRGHLIVRKSDRSPSLR